MLSLIEADEKSIGATLEFGGLLSALWLGNFGADPDVFAAHIAETAALAIKLLRRHVIRHSIEAIPKERRYFGDVTTAAPDVPSATRRDIHDLAIVDRLLRLAHRLSLHERSQTNDPRFHVGRAHLGATLDELATKMRHHSTPTSRRGDLEICRHHLENMRRAMRRARPHPKTRATTEYVASLVNQGEKVLVFCDHHATASEVAVSLQRALPPLSPPAGPTRDVWHSAWWSVLEDKYPSHPSDQIRFQGFIRWLLSPGMRAQIASWLGGLPRREDALVRQLRATRPRNAPRAESIAVCARRLFDALLDEDSSSTRSALLAAGRGTSVFGRAIRTPGGGDAFHHVMTTSPPLPRERRALARDIHFANEEPDLLMAIFNSPFGPDVLVTTDKLSEGVDLHGFCRHVVHHELDPSPVRTVQRNGRIRRINSWASRSRQPIVVAYPSFRGTRDERLVQIMRQRLEQFDLLLGGVNVPVDPEEPDSRQRTQAEILRKVRRALRGCSLAA
jgi:hypothetical protein